METIMLKRLRARLLARLAEALAPYVLKQIECAITHHLRTRAEEYNRHVIEQAGGRARASEEDLLAERLVHCILPIDPAHVHSRPYWRRRPQ